MIVEPLPTNPPGRGRSALRVLLIALPALLLLVVVGAGVLGPSAPAARPAPSAEAGVTASPGVERAVSPSTPAEPGIASLPGYPVSVVNLRVRGVAETLVAHAAGHGPGIVAIAGYLRAWPGPACPVSVPALQADGCPLDAIITDQPRRDITAAFGGFGVHIHAIVAAAVDVPAGGIAERGDPGGLLPVVVIARFPASDTGCTGDLDGCREPFTIERVVWANGVRVPVTPRAAAGLAPGTGDPVIADPGIAAVDALGPITTLLRAVYLDVGDVAGLDPQAGASLNPAGIDPATPVWYLRGVDVPYDPLPDPPYGRRAPTVRWAVLDPVSGRFLGFGVVGDEPQPAL